MCLLQKLAVFGIIKGGEVRIGRLKTLSGVIILRRNAEGIKACIFGGSEAHLPLINAFYICGPLFNEEDTNSFPKYFPSAFQVLFPRIICN